MDELRRRKADALRMLAIDAVEAANSGHPGAPMGLADVAEVLWSKHLRHDPADPHWSDRDRFVLSNGHASMLREFGMAAVMNQPDLWRKYVGRAGAVIGVEDFGASAPAPALYEHFGLTPGAVATSVLRTLGASEAPRTSAACA